jgi:hypothetical protein
MVDFTFSFNDAKEGKKPNSKNNESVFITIG